MPQPRTATRSAASASRRQRSVGTLGFSEAMPVSVARALAVFRGGAL
jgi:hypothetical protein